MTTSTDDSSTGTGAASVRARLDKFLVTTADRVSDGLESRITSIPDQIPTRPGLRGRVALALSDAATWASRTSGRGSGGMIGGMIAATIDPSIMAQINRSRPVALVTGTNGKSTTTRMLAAAVRTSATVATNDGGDNMDAGVVSALHAGGEYDVATLEVDEMHVPAIVDKLRPQVLVLLNLSRDQLDRVGEINKIERTLRACIQAHPEMTVVANCDDVMVTSAAWDSPNVRWVAAGCGWLGESTSCPRTSGAIVRSADGDWFATKPLADGSTFRRPQPDWVLADDTLAATDRDSAGRDSASGSGNGRGGLMVASARAAEESGLPEGTVLPFELALPGNANRGNAAQAVVAASLLGADTQAALSATTQVESVAGRYSTIRYGEHDVHLLLAKNPAGWQEALSMVDRQASGLVIATNGQVADGVDLSWIWDVRFEHFEDLAVKASGERGADLAVRLGYAEVEHELIKDPLAAIRACPPGQVEVLANYTAFRDLKRALERQKAED